VNSPCPASARTSLHAPHANIIGACIMQATLGRVLSFVARYAAPRSACRSIDKGGPLIKINALVVNDERDVELSARPSIPISFEQIGHRMLRRSRSPACRENIRTFVKRFLAATCRNRPRQIGRRGKKRGRAFGVSVFRPVVTGTGESPSSLFASPG